MQRSSALMEFPFQGTICLPKKTIFHKAFGICQLPVIHLTDAPALFKEQICMQTTCQDKGNSEIPRTESHQSSLAMLWGSWKDTDPERQGRTSWGKEVDWWEHKTGQDLRQRQCQISWREWEQLLKDGVFFFLTKIFAFCKSRLWSRAHKSRDKDLPETGDPNSHHRAISWQRTESHPSSSLTPNGSPIMSFISPGQGEIPLILILILILIPGQ